MNKLYDSLASTSTRGRKTQTSNNAVTHSSSLDSVLDFFSQGGALRGKDDKTILSLFKPAFFQNQELALKCLFYFRDVRGGQGERNLFKVCFTWVATNYPQVAEVNLSNLVFYGRWDDVFSLFGTPLEDAMIHLVGSQLESDMDSKAPSLCAKWMPSINTSSEKTKVMARKFIKSWRTNDRTYRKMLSSLRKKINVLEKTLCQGNWKGINYSHVPSKAGLLYRKAFHKHDPEGYTSYLSSVEKGEAKINTGAIYPHEIAHKVLAQGENNNALDVMWANLPNYLEGSEGNRLVVADTSGSMTMNYHNDSKVRPLDVCVGLALYLAERNEGPFKDSFITFSSSPAFVQVEGANLTAKLRNISMADWGMNTNLQAVFNLVLVKAIKNRVQPKDMPKEIYIISDMEFDSCGPSLTNFELVKKKYAAAGYPLPKTIFWNVNASSKQSPVLKDEFNAVLVSGFSPRIMTNILASKDTTPQDFMLEVLRGERYARVTV